MAAQPLQLIPWRGLRAAAAGLVLAVAAGCVPPDFGRPDEPPATPAPRPRAPAKVPAPAPAPVPAPAPAPAPGPGSALPEPPPVVRQAPPVSPAGQALLAESRGHQAAGRYPQAAASIERALRIEPRQPVLWLELGTIRLKEGNAAQAESMARKALSLANGDPAIEARAEQLIARARQ
jgi:hypothetical protein